MLSGLSDTGMLAYSLVLLSWLAGRFRSRAELELEVIALRHQLGSPASPSSWPPSALRARSPTLDLALSGLATVLNIMVLVKPATVVQWHRQGFRLYWRWRSRSGRRQ
jgi:putative transposase